MLPARRADGVPWELTRPHAEGARMTATAAAAKHPPARRPARPPGRHGRGERAAQAAAQAVAREAPRAPRRSEVSQFSRSGVREGGVCLLASVSGRLPSLFSLASITKGRSRPLTLSERSSNHASRAAGLTVPDLYSEAPRGLRGGTSPISPRTPLARAPQEPDAERALRRPRAVVRAAAGVHVGVEGVHLEAGGRTVLT